MNGTDLQEVFDAFFIKIPQVDFSEKESEIIQFLGSAISKCHKHTYDDLSYNYDSELKEGHFNFKISKSSVELVSMYMVKEFLAQRFSLIMARKRHLGTQAFNKLNGLEEEFNLIKGLLNYWTTEIESFLMEFPDYSDER